MSCAPVAENTDVLPHATRMNWPVQAWRHLMDRSAIQFVGGPVLTAPEDLPLRHWRSQQVADDFEPTATYDDYLAGTWNYLGPVFHHFGHIMSEFVHRVLPARRIFKHDQWLAVADQASPPMTFETCPPAYQDVLSLLGVGPHNLKIINRDTIVERLNLAAQGTHLGGNPIPAYLAECQAFTNKVLDSTFDETPEADRVYVSRSRLARISGNFLGEAFVEEWLEKAGFYIFHPQDHSILQQMQVYRKAKVLLFAEGSACHGVELFGPEMLGHVRLLSRRPGAYHLGIFRSVLVPRARTYDEILGGKLLLPIMSPRDPSDDGWNSFWAQALFGLDSLAAGLREFGVLPVPEHDRKEYFRCAAEDFERHVSAWRLSDLRQWASIEIDEQRLNNIRAMIESGISNPSQLVLETKNESSLLPDLAGLNYQNALQKLHQMLSPLTYLEIGSFTGASLSLAAGTAIAIDPNLTMIANPMAGKTGCLLFQMTSDEFFERYNPLRLLGTFIDFAFLDGLHLFEYLLRDFINVEKSCGPNSVIVLHDCVPTDVGIADREGNPKLRPAHPGWWTGDVWKLVPILRTWRPDLKITVLDAFPTGLVVIQGLDPRSSRLASGYDEICAKWSTVTLSSYGLERFHAELNMQSTDAFLADLEAGRLTRDGPLA